MKHLYSNNGKTSQFIEDVIEDKLIIKEPIISLQKHNYYKLFSNIELLYSIPENLTGLCTEKFNIVDMTLDHFSELFYDSLKAEIKKTYNPRKKNVLFFSSGYDSRFIGKIISDIHNGKNFDNLTIIIRSPEEEYAIDILKYLKFPESCINIYYANDTESFNWKNLGLDVSGVCEFPANIFLNPLRAFGISDKAEIYSGLFFNESFNSFLFNRLSFSDWYKCYYHSRIVKYISRIKNNFHIPLLNYDTLKLMINCNITDFKTYTLISDCRVDMLQHLDKGLSLFPRQDELFTRQIRSVNEEQFSSLVSEYNNSFIGKLYPVTPEINYESRFSRNWWTHCTLASFIGNINTEVICQK